MVRDFTDYTSLRKALEILQKNVLISPKREVVPLALSWGRVLHDDVESRIDIPARDSSHMDGFAVRSSDLAGASMENPVELRRIDGAALGLVPRRGVRRGEAHSVLTGGFVPKGADSVVQAERVRATESVVSFSSPVEKGEYVYPQGRDVKNGERVLSSGRVIRGADLVLLGSLHLDKVAVFAKPRVAIIPTGDELTENIRHTELGMVAETHSFLLSRLIAGAGGVPVQMPIARDDAGEIRRSVRVALRTADLVLTVAGSSVSHTDLTEEAINAAGRPGILVHGMKVTRGRVMGFGAVAGTAVVILPGPIQGAVNAFALMAYPVIRSLLGRKFEQPPSIPARMGNDWEAGKRFRDFTKVVYVRTDPDGDAVSAHASGGETENVKFLTQNDGYLLIDEDRVELKKGDPVRVHFLPGFSSSP